jgi:hypothetical protein
MARLVEVSIAVSGHKVGKSHPIYNIVTNIPFSEEEGKKKNAYHVPHLFVCLLRVPHPQIITRGPVQSFFYLTIRFDPQHRRL